MDSKFVDLDRWRKDAARNFLIIQQYLTDALVESLQTGEPPSVVKKLRALNRIPPGGEEAAIAELLGAHLWTEIHKANTPPSLEYCQLLDETIATEQARSYLEKLISKPQNNEPNN